MTLSPRTQALIWRALLGLVLVEIPVITVQLGQPVFDWRLLAVGLLGAAAGFLEKFVGQQLTSPEATPTIPTITPPGPRASDPVMQSEPRP